MPTSPSPSPTPRSAAVSAAPAAAEGAGPGPRPDGRALLSVRDVARLDGCSERTVRRAIAAGLLAAIRIGPGGRLLRISPGAHAAYRHASWR